MLLQGSKVGEGKTCSSHEDCVKYLFCSSERLCEPCEDCHRRRDSIDQQCTHCGIDVLGTSRECNLCFAHHHCPKSYPFCYEGMCSTCEDCVYCADGIDFTCGPDCDPECIPPTPGPTAAPTIAPLPLDMPESPFSAAGIEIGYLLVGFAAAVAIVLVMRCLNKRKKGSSTGKSVIKQENSEGKAGNPFSSSNYYKDREKHDTDELRDNTIAIPGNPTLRKSSASTSSMTQEEINILQESLRKASTSQLQRKLSQRDAIARKKSGQKRRDFDAEALRKASGARLLSQRESHADLLQSFVQVGAIAEAGEQENADEAYAHRAEAGVAEIVGSRVKFKI